MHTVPCWCSIHLSSLFWPIHWLAELLHSQDQAAVTTVHETVAYLLPTTETQTVSINYENNFCTHNDKAIINNLHC